MQLKQPQLNIQSSRLGQFAADRRVVAIVDDNPADVALIAMAVRGAVPDVCIETYTNGEEILNRVHSTFVGRAPDLILLDLYMPGMGGLEALTVLKENPATRLIPVVAVSGAVADDEVAQAYEGHANCVIRKSGNVDEYLQAVSECALFWLTIAVCARGAHGTFRQHA